MFPTRELLAGLAGREGSELGEHPFAVLLAAHAEASSSGMLVARRGRIEKRVLLERGVPVDCRSNLVHETLSRFLVTVGKLSDRDSNAALSRATAEGRLLGEMLVEEGVLEVDELQRLLQQSLARKLFDLFAWRDGALRFEAGSHRSETAQRLKVPRLIVTGVERFTPQEIVDRQVGAFAGQILALHPDHASLAVDLRPNERERALFAQLATPGRIEELMSRIDAPAEEISRLVWGLALVGLLVPADSLPRRAAIPPSSGSRVPADSSREVPREVPAASPREVPADSPAPPGVPPIEVPPIEVSADSSESPAETSPAEEGPASAPSPIEAILREENERLRNRVRSAAKESRGRDPFEILGVPDDATLEEVRDRFSEFAREFGPWQFSHPDLADVESLARELFFSGAVAFARLADPRERESLRVSRRARRESAVRESKQSYFRIETDLLDAEAQFDKGMKLKEAGKWDLALQQLDFAVDCDPQNGVYRAEAALARFRLAPSQQASKVIEELKEAQRVDPRAPDAFLYAGELCMEMLRFAEAEIHLRKAARLLGPDDRRALDRLAELGQRKRKKR